MASTNKADWSVSYIDENGVYNGDVVGDVTGNLDGIIVGNSRLYSADGAISIDDRLVTLNAGTASTVMTLADGVGGQRIAIVCESATNTCTVGFAGFSPVFNLITFNAPGDAAVLEYFDNGAGSDYWICTSLVGTAAIS
jgi:hypothetical protein